MKKNNITLKNPLTQRDVLNGQITLTKFALQASEVSLDSEMMGKINFSVQSTTSLLRQKLH